MMRKWDMESFLSQTRWFHGTRREYAVNIIIDGPKAGINNHKPSDFGKGFYLCPNRDWSIKYARGLLTATDEDTIVDDNDGIVLEFYFDPRDYINFKYKYFDAMTPEYAKFVYHNWKHPYIPHINRFNSFIFGPMTDGRQLYLMTALKNNEIDKSTVLKELMNPKEDWQLTLKSQKLCNQLKLVKTYNLKGDEVYVI